MTNSNNSQESAPNGSPLGSPVYEHFCGPRKGILNVSEVPKEPIKVRNNTKRRKRQVETWSAVEEAVAKDRN